MKTQRRNNIDFSTVVEEIEAIPYDIRAEVIANELIENYAIHHDEITISNVGQFSRAYRSDVLAAAVHVDDYGNQEYVTLALSRDSIYDSLPEGFTHSLSENNGDKSVVKMIKEHKYQKRQEAEARKFFAPFENEIFHYRTQIESVERDFLFQLNGTKPLSFFYDFWGLSTDFPKVLVSKLIQILPYAYKIVGDIDMACRSLSAIIGEKVNYNTTTSKKYTEKKEEIRLGENRLGVDFIIGDNYIDYSMNLTIEIGPIKNHSFDKYLHNGEMKTFIDCFYEHFFPMEVEMNTIIIMDSQAEEFDFNKQPVLGYTTRI